MIPHRLLLLSLFLPACSSTSFTLAAEIGIESEDSGSETLISDGETPDAVSAPETADAATEHDTAADIASATETAGNSGDAADSAPLADTGQDTGSDTGQDTGSTEVSGPTSTYSIGSTTAMACYGSRSQTFTVSHEIAYVLLDVTVAYKGVCNANKLISARVNGVYVGATKTLGPSIDGQTFDLHFEGEVLAPAGMTIVSIDNGSVLSPCDTIKQICDANVRVVSGRVTFRA